MVLMDFIKRHYTNAFQGFFLLKQEMPRNYNVAWFQQLWVMIVGAWSFHIQYHVLIDLKVMDI